VSWPRRSSWWTSICSTGSMKLLAMPCVRFWFVPLMQAYAVIVKPAEAELNRVWMAQVFEPYQRTLASKYPFDRQARMEASPVEVAKIFGTEGL
jgi:type VI protein secretion system component VasK